MQAVVWRYGPAAELLLFLLPLLPFPLQISIDRWLIPTAESVAMYSRVYNGRRLAVPCGFELNY